MPSYDDVVKRYNRVFRLYADACDELVRAKNIARDAKSTLQTASRCFGRASRGAYTPADVKSVALYNFTHAKDAVTSANKLVRDKQERVNRVRKYLRSAEASLKYYTAKVSRQTASK